MRVDGKIKVAIADDHPLIREGIKRLVEQASDIEVVGEASNGREAIELIKKSNTDLLILDLQMPIMDGIQVIDFLAKEENHILILVISAQDDRTIVQTILSKGVSGYYVKEDVPNHLITAIRRAVHGAEKNYSPRFSGFSFTTA